jgi:hypothetical protein
LARTAFILPQFHEMVTQMSGQKPPRQSSRILHTALAAGITLSRSRKAS